MRPDGFTYHVNEEVLTAVVMVGLTCTPADLDPQSGYRADAEMLSTGDISCDQELLGAVASAICAPA